MQSPHNDAESVQTTFVPPEMDTSTLMRLELPEFHRKGDSLSILFSDQTNSLPDPWSEMCLCDPVQLTLLFFPEAVAQNDSDPSRFLF
ncbi:hypothetical protein TNCV_2372191 [Trichonephila clavipes]|nr:hypothetical protein TNCV_2372191 [Trichonephila clavipes]